MENKETQEKVLKAAKSHLRARGYTIKAIQPSEHVDLVADDQDGELVFVSVVAKKDNCETVRPSREQLEDEAAEYLRQTDDSDVQIRFDILTIDIVRENQAFIKQHKNAYMKGCDLAGILDELLEAGEITPKAYGKLNEAFDL